METHQEIGVRHLGKLPEQIAEPDRVDFGRSAAGFGKTHQCRFLKQLHGSSRFPEFCHILLTGGLVKGAGPDIS
jgi:hypothetical protein